MVPDQFESAGVLKTDLSRYTDLVTSPNPNAYPNATSTLTLTPSPDLSRYDDAKCISLDLPTSPYISLYLPRYDDAELQAKFLGSAGAQSTQLHKVTPMPNPNLNLNPDPNPHPIAIAMAVANPNPNPNPVPDPNPNLNPDPNPDAAPKPPEA